MMLIRVHDIPGGKRGRNGGWALGKFIVLSLFVCYHFLTPVAADCKEPEILKRFPSACVSNFAVVAVFDDGSAFVKDKAAQRDFLVDLRSGDLRDLPNSYCSKGLGVVVPFDGGLYTYCRGHKTEELLFKVAAKGLDPNDYLVEWTSNAGRVGILRKDSEKGKRVISSWNTAFDFAKERYTLPESGPASLRGSSAGVVIEASNKLSGNMKTVDQVTLFKFGISTYIAELRGRDNCVIDVVLMKGDGIGDSGWVSRGGPTEGSKEAALSGSNSGAPKTGFLATPFGSDLDLVISRYKAVASDKNCPSDLLEGIPARNGLEVSAHPGKNKEFCFVKWQYQPSPRQYQNFMVEFGESRAQHYPGKGEVAIKVMVSSEGVDRVDVEEVLENHGLVPKQDQFRRVVADAVLKQEDLR